MRSISVLGLSVARSEIENFVQKDNRELKQTDAVAERRRSHSNLHSIQE